MLTDISTVRRRTDGTITRVQTGVYRVTGQWFPDQIGSIFFRKGVFNFGLGSYQCEDDGQPDFDHRRNFTTYDPYGHADTVEQVLEFYGSLLHDPAVPLVIEVTDRVKTPQAGWRWHKNGPYIGDQRPEREYFCDEPEIDRVLNYHIRPLSGLTPEAFTRFVLDYYGRYAESRRTPWEDLPADRQRLYETHAFHAVDMVQCGENDRMYAPKSDAEHLEVLARNYAYRISLTGPAKWEDLPTKEQDRCRRYIDTVRDCLTATGLSWLPPLKDTDHLLKQQVYHDTFDEVLA